MSSDRKRVFVFVVCGAKEHIDTIHFSLKSLRYFTQYDIVVVTDSSRNETAVQHHNIIDIKTPEHFSHHQASIYLKTGLHKFLPKGNLYCYLDTDVIALSHSVNSIFDHKTSVIMFAPDHSRMRQFSPYAVHCGCLTKNRNEWSELNALLKRYYTNPSVVSEEMLPKQETLRRKFELIKQSPFSLLQIAMKYALPGSTLQLDADTFYHKKEHYWFDADGKTILFDYPATVIRQIESNSKWRWSSLKRRWISPAGRDIHSLECGHLREKIQHKFGIAVEDDNWQHWNGGVFLFDENSYAFMDAWHDKTMQIFSDPDWKTRDQGTLIATVWEFRLQKNAPLSKHYNFIADYSNPQLMISTDRNYISDDAFVTKYSPAFIHIFHQFGVGGWNVWDWVEEILFGKKERTTEV
jgi:hypothetical protein